jgi:hypothetical protein
MGVEEGTHFTFAVEEDDPLSYRFCTVLRDFQKIRDGRSSLMRGSRIRTLKGADKGSR